MYGNGVILFNISRETNQENTAAKEEVKENNSQSKLNESNFVLPTPTITSTPIVNILLWYFYMIRQNNICLLAGT